MKKTIAGFAAALAVCAACAPQIHLDFLGRERLEEITLIPGPAGDKILMIDIEGLIAAEGSGGPLDREKNAMSRAFRRLDRAARDPRIKAVILRVDTPGGEVTASDIIYHEILRFKERTGRPVVCLMMGVAASGGYYIASACDVLMAHPSTLTGSIGVISIFPNVEALMAKIGVQVEVIKSGAAKDSGSPFRGMTVEEKTVYQKVIDDFYEGFLRVVAGNRKNRIPADKLRGIADGRIYTASQALELGLIDGIGYFDDAYRKAMALASLRSARLVAYTHYPKTNADIYAGRLGSSPSLDAKALESWLGILKTGFYYLWLPRTQ